MSDNPEQKGRRKRPTEIKGRLRVTLTEDEMIKAYDDAMNGLQNMAVVLGFCIDRQQIEVSDENLIRESLQKVDDLLAIIWDVQSYNEMARVLEVGAIITERYGQLANDSSTVARLTPDLARVLKNHLRQRPNQDAMVTAILRAIDSTLITPTGQQPQEFPWDEFPGLDQETRNIITNIIKMWKSRGLHLLEAAAKEHMQQTVDNLEEVRELKGVVDKLIATGLQYRGRHSMGAIPRIRAIIEQRKIEAEGAVNDDSPGEP